MTISEITQGFIDTLEEVSHDPDEADYYDLYEYIEQLPNTAKVLREFAVYMHAQYL
jgi:hypothetical protein